MNIEENRQKIVVIVGPTASGKTALSLALACAFSGEVVSADSRQVYRTLNIGTEKITPEEMGDIPHHLIDIRDPHKVYTAAEFVRDADATIAAITDRGHLPIIAGGTFFYVDALLGEQSLSNIPPNEALRTELETHTAEELFAMLAEQDSVRAATIDQHNRRRLIRALEIVQANGSVPPPSTEQRYDACIISIDVPRDVLRARIDARFNDTLARGLIEETQTLLASGLSHERLDEIGLEYRVVLEHLDGTISKDEMITKIKNRLWQYAKRQRTWLKRMQHAHIVSYDTASKQAQDIVKKFLSTT